MMALVNDIVSSTWFQLSVVAIGGFTGGVWLDYLLRKREEKAADKRADTET